MERPWTLDDYIKKVSANCFYKPVGCSIEEFFERSYNPNIAKEITEQCREFMKSHEEELSMYNQYLENGKS